MIEGNEILPYKAIPAGYTLLREIKERGYSQKEFAEKLGMKESNFNSLLKGETSITTDIALQLENILGISANIWLNLQKRYELTLKREDLIRSPYYWVADIQLSLFQAAQTYMNKHNMNRKQFAEYLGVSRGCVSKLLSGDYNFSIEKLAEISIKLGYTPKINLIPLTD